MYRIVALTFFVIVGLIMGCSNGNKTASTDSGVLNVAPAPIPAAEPLVAAQPIADSTPIYNSSSANTSSVAMSSKKYTVKKGDTLFSIAKTSYGTGRDWQKIVAANPGLEPSKLKVGQTITIP